MKPQGARPEGTAAAPGGQASKGAVTEGFFFAQQTDRGGTRKIRRAQAVAKPQGLLPRGRLERAAAPQEAWRKTQKHRCTIGSARRSVRPALGNGCVKRGRSLTFASRRYRRSQLASARLGRNDASVLITAADRTQHGLPKKRRVIAPCGRRIRTVQGRSTRRDPAGDQVTR